MRRRRTMARALIGFLLVIGVVAMHGLTMNHDASMPGMGTGHSTSGDLNGTDAGHRTLMASASAIGSGLDLAPVVRAGSAVAAAVRVVTAGTAHSMHAATTCCVAYLTSLLVLLGAGRLLVRRRSFNHDSSLRRDAAWFATAVERLRPDLAELSVLRT
jgi:hypothetical protein